MPQAVMFSMFLICACTLLHYESLKLLNEFLPRANMIRARAKVLVAIGGASLSHMP